jgi:small subunit ribosomal protein S16
LATKIKLARVGAPHRASYRIIVTDSRKACDSSFIENVGFWNPVAEPEEIKVKQDRILEWLSKGAEPTESVVKILKRANVWSEFLKLQGGRK